MKENKILALTDLHIMNTYRRVPIALTKGEGARVWDAEGKKYLDFVAGIAVCNLGHSHPKVVKAIQEQAKELMHVSNLYYTRPQAEVAALLTKHSFAEKVFFCNSGAEANEAAIKLARKYSREHLGSEKYEILTMKNSFHGRTMATITATGQEKFHVGFDPLLDGFKYIPFNDPDAIEAAITPKTCAVMLEPIQGEGGVIIPDVDYLAKVRQICNQHHLLMILDEVQTGIGRTGKMFAYEHSGVHPDIMTLAKALGNGFPVGAMMATDKIACAFSPGNHASTFGGNLLAMAAAQATLLTILEENILENCQEMGAYFLRKLESLKKKHPVIIEVRGLGLMLACSLEVNGADIVKACQEKGLLINCTGEKILRFVPPLLINKEDIDEAIAILDAVLEET